MSHAFRVWLSFVATLVVMLVTPVAPAATLEQFAVFIGNNRGDTEEVALKYAESDASRLRDALQEVGRFPPENTVLVQGQSSQEVQRVLIRVNDRIRASVSRPSTQVVLFVFYSGHADASALHLSGTHLELALIEQLVRSSAADFRVLVLDACRSGSLTRVKGGRSAPPFLGSVSSRLPGEGVVFLTSSSANEDAQESDSLRGSFFTHYLRTGLLGPADRDGNGEVSLDEAYRYAYDNTVRASSTSFSGLQHPTYRYELRGQGRIVLAYLGQPGANRGTLLFPPGRTYLLFERDEHGDVVGEVPAYVERRSLSVRVGDYFVRGRASDSLIEGQVHVSAGGSVMVADATLARVDYARLVRKGGGDQRVVHGPQSAYLFRTELPNHEGLCHGAAVGYPIVYPAMQWMPRVYFCRGGYHNAEVEAKTTEVAAEVEGAVAWDLPWVTPHLLALGGVALDHQRFETRGKAPNRTSFSGYVGAGAGATLMAYAGFYGFVEAVGEAHWMSLMDSDTKKSRMRAVGAYRQLFGVGKYW